MSLFVRSNIASINAQRNLASTSARQEQTLERLSSGLRINSARDDAAGLQISNKLTSQINGLRVAVRNAPAAISVPKSRTCGRRSNKIYRSAKSSIRRGAK